jgi:hypothetical protein
MSWRGISASKSAREPEEAVPITAKWQTANETAAKVTADFDREVEATCKRSSKSRDLSAIEPFLGVKVFLLWFDCPPPTANQVSLSCSALDPAAPFAAPRRQVHYVRWITQRRTMLKEGARFYFTIPAWKDDAQ